MQKEGNFWREKEIKEKKRDSFGILYTGYIIKIKREIERKRKCERDRGGKRGREG